jgi:four helix bundle protein
LAEIQSYKDLKVWQAAMTIAVSCYGLTRRFPKDEMFGMSAQIRRAAVSIAANIAEGHGRETSATFAHFLRISQGSLKELETHLLLAEQVDLASIETIAPVLEQCDELGRMIRSLIRSMEQKAAGRAQ